MRLVTLQFVSVALRETLMEALRLLAGNDENGATEPVEPFVQSCPSVLVADGQAVTKISPNDPDALKLWGDALARQGKGKAAREKYDAGLKLAPNRVDLQKARAAAAKG